MNNETLNKPINLQNLSLALSAVRAEYMGAIQQVAEHVTANGIPLKFSVIFAGATEGEYSFGEETIASVYQDMQQVIAMHILFFQGKCYTFDGVGGFNPLIFKFTSYSTTFEDSTEGTFQILIRDTFILSSSSLTRETYNSPIVPTEITDPTGTEGQVLTKGSNGLTWTTPSASAPPEVYVGSETPSGYTLYIEPEDSIPSGEGADF